MPSYLDSQDRANHLERLARLTPDSRPLWGKMTAGQLLALLIDIFEVTFAEREVTVRPGFMNSAFGRWLLVDAPLPFPKNSPTDPEYLKRPTGDFELDQTKVLDYIKRFAEPDRHTFGPSPWVGKLTPTQWAKLHHKHLEHHLKQFGL